MNPAKKLRIAIENCEIPHLLFREQLNPLRRRIEDAIDGAAYRLEYILGPSRVGKSMLIQALRRNYPETIDNGRRKVPVLVVPLPSPISPVDLPFSVLDALGLPVGANLKPSVLRKRMRDQLKLAETRVTIFEEASHLVEVGTRVPPRAGGDWFKTFADSLNMTVFLFGVPRLERLIQHNEQLRMRASAARWLMPYDSRINDHLQTFHDCVATYANLFRQAGFPIALPESALSYHCYLLTGGLIGVLSRFMQELASQLADESPRPVMLADCQAAVQSIQVAGSRHILPFEQPQAELAEISPAALHQAFVQVMHDNELPVPLIQEMGSIR